MLSVIVPALNEEKSIGNTIECLRKVLVLAQIEHEIIVVNDGSTDQTGKIASGFPVKMIHHPSPGGYGRSIKDGIREAKYDLIAITDADETYPIERLPELFNDVYQRKFDMAVGARTGKEYQGSFLKMPARRLFNWLCEYATGREIADINSGFRVFRKEIPLKFWNTICDGFSFTTTITLAALLNGYFVSYIPIPYFRRSGTSHVRYYRDTLRSLQIIIENILYYNPLKLFLLIVNFLISCSFVFGLFFQLSTSKKARGFFSFFSGMSFASAFIVGAIGLAADLVRMGQKNTESP